MLRGILCKHLSAMIVGAKAVPKLLNLSLVMYM